MASSENFSVTIEAELDAFFAQYVAAGHSRGLAYGLVDKYGLLHASGFGAANEDDVVPSSDTIFPIASMTKSFVACAALVARDRGLLSLDDPITIYFPEFIARGTAEDPCDPPTLGLLFSMSGGLTEDNSWVDPFIHANEQELLARVGRGLRYSHVPGVAYEYSNLGYTLAGLAVGRAAGQTIEEFVTAEVVRPLGLTSTFFDSSAPADIKKATGFFLDTDGQWAAHPPNVSAAFAAAGGIMSTVRDLSTWVTWLGSAFRSSSPDDIMILSRASRRELQRIHILDTPSLTISVDGGIQPSNGGYGLGLFVSVDLRRGTLVSHGGGLPRASAKSVGGGVDLRVRVTDGARVVGG